MSKRYARDPLSRESPRYASNMEDHAGLLRLLENQPENIALARLAHIR
jgi:hypothetical protein